MKVDLPRAIFLSIGGLLLFLFLLCPASSLSAEEYPARPIKLIVPFSVGGDADVIGRILSDSLGAELKQRIVVENVTGAGGNIGVERVIRSEPDGYTLLLAPMGVLSVNPTLYKGLTFDASKELVPISLAYETGHLVVVNPSLQVRSLTELGDLIRSKPGKFSFGSGGIGTSTHLYGEVFKMTAKVDILHVPYRGNGQALNDVIAGQIQIMFPQIASAASQAASGLVTPLAVTTDRRAALLPDVPTVVEAGMPELAGTSWGGIMAPRGTPPEVVARLNGAIVKVLNSSDTRGRFEAIGINARTSTPDELGHLIDVELVRWRRVIAAANLTLN
jgi:tripartite-type tricarboxylate transporter receptor subunit TctC